MNMPRRDDEVQLWSAFGPGARHEFARDAAAELGIPAGRLQYLCEKWARRGIYDYGVRCDLGWKCREEL